VLRSYGHTRERVVAAAVKAFNDNPEDLIPEYPYFPDPLHEPHLETFTKFRGQLGDAQGVERSDKVGRRRDVARQFMFFDASAQLGLGGGKPSRRQSLSRPSSIISAGILENRLILQKSGR
jgi:hypothetical protein